MKKKIVASPYCLISYDFGPFALLFSHLIEFNHVSKLVLSLSVAQFRLKINQKFEMGDQPPMGRGRGRGRGIDQNPAAGNRPRVPPSQVFII